MFAYSVLGDVQVQVQDMLLPQNLSSSLAAGSCNALYLIHHLVTHFVDFLQVVEDAINAGIDRFSFDDRDNVKRSKRELRIADSLAKEILDKVARKAFVQFVTRSRGQRDKLEAAKELKKMVFFSNIVVAALLDDVQVCRLFAECQLCFAALL